MMTKLAKIEMDCLAGALTLLESHNILEKGISEKVLKESGFEGLFELLDNTHNGEHTE